MKFAWIDLRAVARPQLESVLDAAIHARIEAVVSDDQELLKSLPPTVRGVTPTVVTEEGGLHELGPEAVGWVDVRDDRTLKLACAAAVVLPHTVVRFADPTKIPLEIVLAAADRADGRLITVCADLEESRPLLTITARSADGVQVSLTVQDDWHVRVLGPGAKVLNVTELQAGDELLGYSATDQRHVGYPIGEFCKEN
jgi:3-amino-4-hydroxybenzoic acid synthase